MEKRVLKALSRLPGRWTKFDSFHFEIVMSAEKIEKAHKPPDDDPASPFATRMAPFCMTIT